MNILKYIDKYGNKTFEEEPFNEIDNIVLVALSYLDLKKYVSNNSKNKKSINSVAEEYFKYHNIKEKNIIATKEGLKILISIKDKKRYKNLLLYNYTYIGNNNEQFSAITIEINQSLVYISFEGTDSLISGWKEDFMMGYVFPVLSQKHAIKYINKNFLFTNKKLIIGGHSKGGNLAQVAGMYCNNFIKKRIIKIYNNDGPGLREKELNTKNYKKIENKLIHIIPNYSIFGLLLRNNKKYITIKSTKKNILAHDFMTWIVDDKQLKRSTLSNFSIAIEKSGNKWLDKYSKRQIKEFVQSLFIIFEELNIKDLKDIYNNKKNILNLIMKSRNINENTKEMIKDFIYETIKYNLPYKNINNNIK